MFRLHYRDQKKSLGSKVSGDDIEMEELINDVRMGVIFFLSFFLEHSVIMELRQQKHSKCHPLGY
jgi:hypothetical protein